MRDRHRVTTLLREALASTISFEAGLECVGIAETFEAAVALVSDAQPHVLVLDASLAGDVIECIDEGRGIEEADQRRIFQPFYQSGGHTSGEGGAGLGLALVKRCVDLMGGRIRVESSLGHGSTFSFTVPLSGEALSSVAVERRTHRAVSRIPLDRRVGKDRRVHARRVAGL